MRWAGIWKIHLVKRNQVFWLMNKYIEICSWQISIKLIWKTKLVDWFLFKTIYFQNTGIHGFVKFFFNIFKLYHHEFSWETVKKFSIAFWMFFWHDGCPISTLDVQLRQKSPVHLIIFCLAKKKRGRLLPFPMIFMQNECNCLNQNLNPANSIFHTINHLANHHQTSTYVTFLK